MSKNKMLERYFDKEKIEAGIDEAGRGPMFGRVYTAAVILPKDDSFKHELMKDSKRFHSKKKIKEAYDYIKENAVSYCVAYADENIIDNINIRQATLNSMHKSVSGLDVQPKLLLVDGNDFKPYLKLDDNMLKPIEHVCIEGGDDKYTAIAAASILAKVERDTYIEDLCDRNPKLDEIYGIRHNKGYGTRKHLEAIEAHGITEWHRKTYGICRNY